MKDATNFRGFRRIARSAAPALLIAAALGLGAAAAQAQHGPGHGFGGPDLMGPAMFGGPPGHASRMLDGMLDGLNVSDAQRTQIKQIASTAANDLKAQRDNGRALHDKAAQLLAAANVDAAAAEQVRQQMLSLHDQVSRRTLTAMLDISRVLTPDQRAKLGERTRLRGEAMRERSQRMDREAAKQ